MYKVFINDKPIILTDSLVETLDYLHFSFEKNSLDDIIKKLKIDSLKGVVLVCKDLEKSWDEFQSHFTKIISAGGLVINEKKEALFIYRASKWDLPKGRIEDGEELRETAVREVKEECGVSYLNLKDFLITTYHLFFQKKEQKLKETHWFLMESNSKEKLNPQEEEGITDVKFKNPIQVQQALKNSYANIKLVFEAYDKKV